MPKSMPIPSAVPDGYEIYEDQTFNSFVGPFYVRAEGGNLHAMFEVKPHHLNHGGVLHGGMLMTFADMLLGKAARAVEPKPCATISLNCDFVAAARLGEWVRGTSRVVRKTRSILFLSGEVFTGERTILTASGLWKVIGPGG